MNEYNPAGLRAAAAQLQQTAHTLAAALPPAIPTAPAAADPTSVAAAATVDAQSAAMRSSILAAIAETLAAASGLHAAATSFESTEAANTASLSGSGDHATTPIAAIAADINGLPTPGPIPTPPPIPPPTPVADPEPMATLLATGPGPAGLYAHATSWTAMGSALQGASTSSASAAAAVQSSWVSPEGAKATAALGRLSQWYTTAGASSQQLATTSREHGATFVSSKAAHPAQPTIIDAKRAVATASSTGDAPGLAAAMQQWNSLVTQSNATVSGYQLKTASAHRVDAPAPPKITRAGKGANKPKKGDKRGATDKEAATRAGNHAGRLGDEAANTATRGKQALDKAAGNKAANERLAQTAAQIGLQVATQSLQAASSLLGGASSAAGKLATTGLNNRQYPGSPYTPGPGNYDGLGNTGGGSPVGSPLGDEAVGPGAAGAGGDDRGTKPSALNGHVTPIMANPDMPKSPVGAAPAPPPSSLAAGSMHMPYAPMGGMGGMAGMGGLAGGGQRNEKLRPDRPVYVDDTPVVAETIGDDAATIEMAPQITPLFADASDDDDFVSS